MQLSFNGGIVSPEMFGRFDQAKYQTGVAKCSNFYVELYGGLTYRAGLRYVHHYTLAKGKMRLIPFIFSEEQAVILAIRDGAVNFFARGGILLDDNDQPLELMLPYIEEHLMQLRYAQSADVITITHPNYVPRKIIRRGATEWSVEMVTVSYGIGQPQNLTGVAHNPKNKEDEGYVEKDYVYQVTAVNEQNESQASEKSPILKNDLTLAGNTNVLSWDAVPGATRYNVFKLRSGLASYIGETTELSFTDDYIETDGSITPPLIRDPFEFNPTAVAYHGQRKVYGGGYQAPQWLRMSRTATDDNFGYHIPLQDTDSIQIRFAARDGNGVKHLVPISDLMILTSGAVWKLSSDGAMTATSVSVQPQSYVGANDVTPLQIGGAAIFSSDQTGHIHELSQSQGFNSSYQVIDMSIMCPHLFDGHKIIDSAMVRNPLSMLCFVRDDGVLLTLTYDAQQQVWAWAEQRTQGKFLSVAAIPEEDQTVLYCLIERGNFRVIERMIMRQPIDMKDNCLLDSSIQYKGAPTKTISGLDWLEGREVSVFADGGVKPPKKVYDGTITLDRELSNVWIGLNYEGEVQTLPLVSHETHPAKPKVATQVHLRVKGTQNIYAGSDPSMMTEYKPRSLEPYGQPLNLLTGWVQVPVASTYNKDVQITVKHDKPLPMKILAMEVEFK
ncbi:hypothetical protein WMF02_002108 [Acinetobacter baumannii]